MNKSNKKFFLLLICISISSCVTSQTVLELTPSQSMCITGKGPGQDAAINRYSAGNSLGIVKNVGENRLRARIQEAGKIISLTDIEPGQTQKLELRPGLELYLDTEKGSRAKVSFKTRDKQE